MTDILPDPFNPVNALGQPDVNGVKGPGYSSVKLSYHQPVMKDRTNSGRMITRGIAAHYWRIDIGYNPMLREQFDIIYSFILSKRGGVIPFYVSLPQYRVPRNPAFLTNATSLAYNPPMATSMTMTGVQGGPTRGDLFNIEDPLDSAHKKTYMVTGFGLGTVYFNPPLTREVSQGSILRFQNPLIRVVLEGDVQEYSLGVNNLYAYSLKLEEALI